MAKYTDVEVSNKLKQFKRYCVVMDIPVVDTDESYFTIASDWLLSEEQCYWPPKNLYKQVIHQTNEKSYVGWEICKIEIIASYDTYKEALSKEKRKMEYISSSSEEICIMTDPAVTTNLRTKNINTRYRETSVSPPPSLNNQSLTFLDLDETLISQDKEIMLDNDMNEIVILHSEVDNTLNRNYNSNIEIHQDKNLNITTDEESYESKTIQLLETINKKLTKIIILQGEHSKQLDQLNIKVLTSTISCDDKLPTLPINSIADLENLNATLINDEEMKIQLISYLKNVGGKDERSGIFNILKKVFGPQLACICSWSGRSDNYRLNDKTIIEVMKVAAKQSFKDLKDHTFESSCKDWLRSAS